MIALAWPSLLHGLFDAGLMISPVYLPSQTDWSSILRPWPRTTSNFNANGLLVMSLCSYLAALLSFTVLYRGAVGRFAAQEAIVSHRRELIERNVNEWINRREGLLSPDIERD